MMPRLFLTRSSPIDKPDPIDNGQAGLTKIRFNTVRPDSHGQIQRYGAFIAPRPDSSVVEHFLGKEEVVSPILTRGSLAG